jgi:hypothetical protein
MLPASRTFAANARAGLADDTLQRALGLARTGFPRSRRLAIERLPEFEALRDCARSIKNHTLEHLDFYLEVYEENVVASGGRVHWARTPDEALAAVLQICRSVGAKTVTKGKSMVAEEIGLNEYLQANGITPVETDLGEYIIQLRHEPPSHLIAPAIHLMKEQVAERLSPPVYRTGLSLWAWVTQRPALYHSLTEVLIRVLGWAGSRRGRFRTLPLASGWTVVRDMPAPEGRTFHSLWAERGEGATK